MDTERTAQSRQITVEQKGLIFLAFLEPLIDIGDITVTQREPTASMRLTSSEQPAAICQFALAKNEIGVSLVPFPPRFEIDTAFHADASLLAVEHAL